MFETGARNLWDIKFVSMLPLLPEKVLRVDIEVGAVYFVTVSRPTCGLDQRV
jgi:hypothetical protein